MGRLLLFTSRRRIHEDASLWLSRMDRGLDADSQAALEHWIAEDPRHARALVAMASLWGEMDLLRELSGLLELPGRARGLAGGPAWWWAAGAAVPAGLLAAFLLLPRPAIDTTPGGLAESPVAMPPTVQAPTSTPDTALAYETVLGKQRTEVLPDGSIVQLNTATRVEVSYRPAGRDIRVVRGEAYFEVQHDPARPFVVSAGGRKIRAVGTAFNVRLGGDGQLEVTVTAGRIVVSTRSSPGPAGESAPVPREKRVDAGEQLLADVADSQWRIQRPLQETLSNRLAWQRGMLVFEGEPLESALAEVSRYFDVRFEIRDDALRGVRVGGIFKSGDIDGLIRSLEQNLQIVAVRADDGHVVLSAQ